MSATTVTDTIVPPLLLPPMPGRAVDAAEALQFGLANRVVPPGTARAEALLYARALSRHPQLCMRKDRDMALRWVGRQVAGQLVSDLSSEDIRYSFS